MIEWFSPNAIRFSRDEMIFLITHINLLREGDYPPQESGYTEAEHTTLSKSHKAPFEIAVSLSAEVDYRLSRTGEDGETLEHEITQGLDDYKLLSQAAKNALNYISGWRRRKTSYKDWKSHRRSIR